MTITLRPHPNSQEPQHNANHEAAAYIVIDPVKNRYRTFRGGIQAGGSVAEG